MKGVSKLKYRIVYCSGEDQDYPVTELLTQSPQSRGWQAPKYCEYPQEIAIQFVSAARVRQVQFLSHHCKISTKIELYVHMPDKNVPPQYNQIKYKKLGYLSLDSNERGGYQARELKSVYIDTPCLFMKFVFQKCYVNKFNLFNQIGVIALSVFGEPLDSPPGYGQMKQKEFYNEIQFETQFDQNTLERLRLLEEAKDKAVSREDFMEAKRIKEAIERLKQIGVQLRTLEERKAVAIQNEDYDSASIIKQEIEKLRNAVAPDSMIRRPDSAQYQQQPVYQPQQQFQQQQQQQYYQQQQQYQPPPVQSQMAFVPPYQAPPPQMPIQGDEMISQSQFEEQRADPSQMKQKRVAKELNQHHEDMVVPAALRKQNNNQYPDDDKQQQQQYTTEPLTGDSLQKAEPLIPILTEEFCQKIFSKQWGAREDGLKWLEDQIGRPTQVNSQDPSIFFLSSIASINYTLGDKVAAVSIRSLSVLQSLLAKYPKIKINKSAEFNEHIDGILQSLMEKLGEQRKESAENAFLQMADHPSVGPAICVQHLIKGFVGKSKLQSSTKHIVGRLAMLTELVKKYEINNANMPYQPIVDFAVKLLDDKNEPIRTQAILLLVEVYKFTGNRLKQSLTNVRQAQLDVLEDFFNKIDGGGDFDDQPQINQQRAIIQTNIESQGAKKGNQNQTQNQKPQQQQKQQQQQQQQIDQQNTTKCEFCDKVDPSFKNTDYSDKHLWSECPMLVTCSQCGQVIEIAELTNHLLSECDHKRKFKRCPKCKEAILLSGYDKHLEDCRGRNDNTTVRCPLCHQDLKLEKNTWKNHLIKQGCLNNERTAG
ncbi:unnamed protein product [Paramecium pentaurelia]|uniref:TOG domain-containing protein n=1 Tax=Paramecium pentaurelia TaxID=43138 RepID=A0A8S1WJA1_9CILI|nr:unnamed protein product [Paramecium pentaurelia]